MGTYHNNGQRLADLAGALELLLLLLELDPRLLVAAGDLLEVETNLGGEIVVVTLADLEHGLPVVLVHTKYKSENGDEDDGGQKGSNVAR